MRLDQAVAARFPNLSRRQARELIAAGRVLVNQRSVRVASREVADDDELRVAEELPRIAPLAKSDDNRAADSRLRAKRMTPLVGVSSRCTR